MIQIINLPPVLIVADQTVAAGVTANYAIIMTDPESNPSLSLSVAGLQPWISLNGTTLVISPLISTKTGPYPMNVTVSDGALTTISTFNIIVSASSTTSTPPSTFNCGPSIPILT